jgi:hypothetical protein
VAHAAAVETLAARGITAVNVRAPDEPELVTLLGRLAVTIAASASSILGI